MPSLPKAPGRPWQPQRSKREYVTHAARTPDYSTARWQRARLAQLARCPCCVECTKAGRVAPANTVDHITPVRLGGSFWDASNHQSLCTSCHARKSATERRK